MTAALSLQKAMREALLADATLKALLGGGHVFDEQPRGVKPPFVSFETIETRDWSVADAIAHEHFLQVQVATAERGRAQAQAICDAIAHVFNTAELVLEGHTLVNLRLIFWSVARARSEQTFGATLRFRAATEPL